MKSISQRGWFIGIFLITIVLSQLLLTPFALASSLTLAVVPQLPKELTHKNWGPFLYEVKQRAGLDIKLLLFNSFQEFEASFSQGEPDFVYLNPYHQLIANKKQGYIPLIRDNSRMLTGILVVGNGSAIDSIEQLQHQKVAFPSPLAFGASLYMRAALWKQGIEVEPIYVKSHNNVYRSVVLGTVVAGGGVNSTLNAESPQIQQSLKTIFKLPGVPSHPISVHPRISSSIRKEFIAICLELAKTSQGKELLKAIHIPLPVVADQERDYQPLELLNLERFSREDAITSSDHRDGKHGG